MVFQIIRVANIINISSLKPRHETSLSVNHVETESFWEQK